MTSELESADSRVVSIQKDIYTSQSCKVCNSHWQKFQYLKNKATAKCYLKAAANFWTQAS